MPCRVPCTGRRGTCAAGARARRDFPVCRATYVSERSRRGATGPGGDPRISWNWSVDRTAVVALLIGSGAARSPRRLGRSLPGLVMILIVPLIHALIPAVGVGRWPAVRSVPAARRRDGRRVSDPPGDRGAAEPGTSAVSRQPRPAPCETHVCRSGDRRPEFHRTGLRFSAVRSVRELSTATRMLVSGTDRSVSTNTHLTQ